MPRTIDFPRQYHVIGGGIAPAGTFITQFRIPCEGQVSRVDGMIILTCKDYTNQPTIDNLDLQFGNNVYNLMANQLNTVDTYAGAPVAPDISLKETDIGIEIHDFITAPSGLLVLTVNFSVVPDPFMFYIRPRFYVAPYVAGLKTEGARSEVSPDKAFALPYMPFIAEQPMGQTHDVGAITVIKETVKIPR